MVNATVEWPSRSETAFGCTPAPSSCVAWACLKSWNRVRGSSSSRVIRRKSAETDQGANGAPATSSRTTS